MTRPVTIDDDDLRVLMETAAAAPKTTEDATLLNGVLGRAGAALDEAESGTEGTGGVTRFEVIDQTGRALVRYGIQAELSWQDDSRTLKVFLKSRAGADRKATVGILSCPGTSHCGEEHCPSHGHTLGYHEDQGGEHEMGEHLRCMNSGCSYEVWA